jgi:hypothetical protein
MSTDETNGQEAPGVRTAETEDEDTEGHVRTAMGGDAEGGPQEPGVRTADRDDQDDTEGHVRTAVRTADRDEQDDTEGHVRTAMGGDPDFGSQELGVRTADRPDEDDDTEGHVKVGGH